MPTATTLPDLTTDQLAELDGRMKAAREERHRHEAVERGKAQLLRQSRAKFQKVDAEITGIRAEQDAKLQALVRLHERLQGVEEMNLNDPKVRDERMALVEAIDLATEKGAPVVSGITCPSNARPYRLLFDVAPHGTNWRTPLAELGRRLEALTAERDRLQTRLEKLEDTGDVAA